MANISNLNIAKQEDLNLDDYKLSGEGRPFPPAGTYTLCTPSRLPEDAFAANAAGTALTARIDPTLVDGPAAGRELKYIKVSAKTWTDKNQKKRSQLGDYLKACGITGVVPGDPEKQADLVEQTCGLQYQARIDWRLYGKRGDGSIVELEGMKNFPVKEDGTHVPFIELEGETDNTGKPRRIWANLFIKDFVSQ